MNEQPAGTPSDETWLSYIQKFTGHNTLPTTPRPHHLHPYTPVPSDAPVALLRNLVEASSVLSNAIHAYGSLPVSDLKLVSNLRQTSALIHGLHVVKQETFKRIDSLKKRSGTSYGEPIPLDRSLISDWCISRIEQWGKEIGMEIFKDEDKKGHVTIMLGGKVLVLEIDLAVQKNTPTLSDSQISVASVKTSLALPSGTSSGNALAERSASLDEYIFRTWNKYLQEVQGDDVENSMRAAYFARDILAQLSYLMRLDTLAVQEGDSGIRWFNDIGMMSGIAEQVAKTEAESVASSVQKTAADLDILLTRAHALAIPYLVAPTMSFVVYVSPFAYLSLSRTAKTTPITDPIHPPWKVDIPSSILQDYLLRPGTDDTGVTIASLMLDSNTTLPSNYNVSEQIPHLGRPKFRLPNTSVLSALDHSLPIPMTHMSQASNVVTRPGSESGVWVLDFTNAGRSPGIVMTHTRMREIQQVLDPLGSLGGDMHMPPFPGNWVGLLLDSSQPSAEHYIATYTSPSSMHPPLRLRLSSPSEAGFLLGKVPVRSLQEAWGILEVVRDQCWINETLKAVGWTKEDEEMKNEDLGDHATKEELEALLNGTFTPRSIPVNVWLAYQSTSNSIPGFDDDGTGLDGLDMAIPGIGNMGSLGDVPGFTTSSSPPTAPSIVMSIALPTNGGSNPAASSDLLGISSMGFGMNHHHHHPQGSILQSQAHITIAHDPSRRRGVSVRVNVGGAEHAGAMPLSTMPFPFGQQQVEQLEEAVRRGGALGIPGRVWSWSQAAAAKV